MKFLYELSIEIVSENDESVRAILDVVGNLRGNSPGGVGEIVVARGELWNAFDKNFGVAMAVSGLGEDKKPVPTGFYAHGHDPVVLKAVLRDAFELGFDCDFCLNGTVEEEPEAVRQLAAMNARRKLERGESVAG
jgi:hypothetical protein